MRALTRDPPQKFFLPLLGVSVSFVLGSMRHPRAAHAIMCQPVKIKLYTAEHATRNSANIVVATASGSGS